MRDTFHLKPQASALLLALEPCRGLGGVPGFGVEASMHSLPAGLPIVLGDITQVFGPLLVHLWCLQCSGRPPVPPKGSILSCRWDGPYACEGLGPVGAGA